MALRRTRDRTKRASEKGNSSNQTNQRFQNEVSNCFSLSSNREMFCDFTVVVEDVEFPCHRFVLNACSSFFEALLRSDMKESNEMRATVHGMSPHIFRLVLDVIYSGSDVVAQNNMMEMWNAAHQLQIDFLISECEDFVLKNINSENYFTIYSHADLLQSAKVVTFVSNYMAVNFFSVVSSENFLKLCYKDLLQIFHSKQLTVCKDFQIEAILKWCGIENDHKIQNIHFKAKNHNLNFLGNLLQAVDLSQVSNRCLATLLKNGSVQETRQACALVNAQAAAILFNPHGTNKQLFLADYYFDAVPNNCNGQVDRKVTGGSGCQHCQQKQQMRQARLF